MESIAELIQCSICLETFTDPRILPCIHTFCLKCLQQILLKVEKQQSKDKLHCPICRMEITIPPEGVEGFQKNFFMHRLKEITMISKPLEKSCDMCLESKESDEDEVLPADVYCAQCHKYFCKRCRKSHKIIADLAEHQLIPLGTEITENMIKTISHQDCPKHKKEQVKMYCSDCKEVICMVCFAENHQNHKCSCVEDVGNASRLELKDVVGEVDTCLNEWLTKMKQCTDEKTNFQNNIKKVEETVIRRKNELIAFVDKCAHSLLEELATIRQTRLKEIQNQIEENERQLVIIESFKAYCKEIEAKGTNRELCQVVPTLKRRAEEMQQTHASLSPQSTESVELSFERSKLKALMKTGNAIGRIKVLKSEIKDSIYSSRNLGVPPSSRVFGVTKLENKICVLCRSPNIIRIFIDQDSFDLQMEIDIKQIIEPNMMASSEKSKCLYVIQQSSNHIWKITIDDHRVTEWLTDAGKGHGCLSVTSEDQLLSITYDQNNHLQINLYDSASQLICHFPLPSNICYPLHIIRKPNGEFIISHREGSPGGPWVISLLSSDGKTVIGCFNSKTETRGLDQPCHLALDSDKNRLFVADYGKSLVILLDSISLNLMQIVLRSYYNKVILPLRLFYDGKKKQLIVGHWHNRVDVHSFMIHP